MKNNKTKAEVILDLLKCTDYERFGKKEKVPPEGILRVEDVHDHDARDDVVKLPVIDLRKETRRGSMWRKE